MGRLRKYELNDAFFDGVIDSEPKAYVLGMLAADGYLPSRQPQVGIDLHVKDAAILHAIKSAVEFQGPILKTASPHLKRLCWTSPKMRNTLEKMGLTSQKSEDLPALKAVFAAGMTSHFVRGYFDGNGCWSFSFQGSKGFPSYRRRLRMEVRATPAFCRYLCRICPMPLDYSFSVTGRLRLSTDAGVCEFGKWIYSEASMYLVRKRLVFNSAVSGPSV